MSLTPRYPMEIYIAWSWHLNGVLAGAMCIEMIEAWNARLSVR